MLAPASRAILLRGEGMVIDRKHVSGLMRGMVFMALHRKPNTGKKTSGRAIYPYLLRALTVILSNRVWATNIG